MKKYIVSLVICLSVTSFFLNGKNFIHPGMLHTQADFDRVKQKLAEGQEPWVSAFERLASGHHVQPGYTPNPQEKLTRGGWTIWEPGPDTYQSAMNDAAAAYQCGLMWRITGEKIYAEKAIQILNGWANVCRSLNGDSNVSLASGIYGYEFANAGELVRDYEGWPREDFRKFQDFMLRTFYPTALDFLERRHGTCAGSYWSNWGTANLLTLMSIGILCDDVYIYNKGLSYYKEKSGEAESYHHLVWKLFEDERGPFGYLGQMQESNRDQSHTMMAVGMASDICTTALNQGDDLFTYDNDRIAAGFEYVAAYNSGVDDVPNSPYYRFFLADDCQNEEYPVMGEGGRGGGRPIWARIVNYYENRRGVDVKYSRTMMEEHGIDAGGGSYGWNSGGFDHLGFTILMNTLDPMDRNLTPTILKANLLYNGVEYTERSYLINAERGSKVKLIPSLPDGTADTGLWKWDSGETTKDLEVELEESRIYRVEYTNEKGVKSTQMFSIAVEGDCSAEVIAPVITVNDVIYYNETSRTILPRSKVELSLHRVFPYAGTVRWNDGSTGMSVTIPSFSISRTYTATLTNQCGVETVINFEIDVNYLEAHLKVNDGTVQKTNIAYVDEGGKVELMPTVYREGGEWLWSDGSKGNSLLLENVQQSGNYWVKYTYNNVEYMLDYEVKSYMSKKPMAEGDYFIKDAEKDTYLTNVGFSNPIFNYKDGSDVESQLFTISKDGARYNVISKKDGRYVNEVGDFGTNPYYTVWNTYDFHNIIGTNLYAVQNGGSSGTEYWFIVDNRFRGRNQGKTILDEFPFEIIFYDPNSIDENFISSVCYKVYPNPATEYIMVDITEDLANPVLYISDLSGEIVKTEKCVTGTNRIHLSGLNSSVYIGTLISETGRYSFKILKK